MKKKLMFLVTCLMLTAACLLGGKTMTVQAATAYQPLDLRVPDVRQKVGTKYFWTTWTDAGRCQLRYSTSSTGSGYLIKSFSDGFATAEGLDNTVVTNGTKLYFTSSGNTLYCYTLSGSTTSSNYTTKALNTTLKNRLDTTKVSSRVVGVSGDRIYISVRDAAKYERNSLFCCQGTKVRIVMPFEVVAQNSKYLFLLGAGEVLRYNMAEQDMEYFAKNFAGSGVILNGGKLFTVVANSTYTKQYLRAYDVETKSYTTLKTVTGENIGINLAFYYNGYLYYELGQYSDYSYSSSYYKIKVADKTVTKLRESTYYSAMDKATVFAY